MTELKVTKIVQTSCIARHDNGQWIAVNLELDLQHKRGNHFVFLTQTIIISK